jgi:hypothetical protein
MDAREPGNAPVSLLESKSIYARDGKRWKSLEIGPVKPLLGQYKVTISPLMHRTKLPSQHELVEEVSKAGEPPIEVQI